MQARAAFVDVRNDRPRAEESEYECEISYPPLPPPPVPVPPPPPLASYWYWYNAYSQIFDPGGTAAASPQDTL